MADHSISLAAKSRFFCSKLAPLVLAIALAGCASKKQSVGAHSGPDTGSAYSQSQVHKAVSSWGEKYARDPKDKSIALNYAAALRLNNQSTQAVAVLRKAMISHKGDREIASAYGKALAADGKFDEALRVIRAAHSPDQPDWRLLSAEGAILDQTGNHNDARRLYHQALKIRPGDPTVLNNLGLSHALTGDLSQAEKVLRKAAARPGADSRVRQNLSLVLGLRGNFDEAEKVAMNELDPAQARANIAYLKRMLSQRNTWDDLKKES